LRDAEEVFHQDVPADGVVEGGLLPPVGDHQAEGDGARDLPLDGKIRSFRFGKEEMQPGRPFRGDGEGGGVLREEPFVEGLGVGQYAFPALHEGFSPSMAARQPDAYWMPCFRGSTGGGS
jgi:hypothetical protein